MFSCQWYRIRAILRSIYVHSFTDDEGRFHIMLVKLNSIQPFSVYQEIISHIRGLVSIRTSRYIWLLLIHGTGCKTKKSLRNLWNKCEAGAFRKLPLGKLQFLELSVSWWFPPLCIFKTSASWLPLMEVKSNQCCGTYCSAHRNIVKTIGKNNQTKQTDLNQLTTNKNYCKNNETKPTESSQNYW